jgi:rhodanese-related sulfurtransferase
LLGAPTEDAFVRGLIGTFGTYPTYFARLREVNRPGPTVYRTEPHALTPLSANEVQGLLGEGGELVDARPVRDFAAGHIPGALSIELRPAFASWLGWLVPEDRPLVFVLNADQDRADLVRQPLKVGYEHLAGELAGGMPSWRAAGVAEATVGVEEIARGTDGTVLDVRQASEFASGHLPGAAHVELGSLMEAGDLPSGPVALMCGHGERAMTAASVLQRGGRRGLTVLLGGPGDWSRITGRPLERA